MEYGNTIMIKSRSLFEAGVTTFITLFDTFKLKDRQFKQLSNLDYFLIRSIITSTSFAFICAVLAREG